MANSQRRHIEDTETKSTDMPITSRAAQPDAAAANVADNDEYEVVIKIPNKDKAAKNDYKEANSWEIEMAAFFTGEEHEPLTEEEGREAQAQMDDFEKEVEDGFNDTDESGEDLSSDNSNSDVDDDMETSIADEDDYDEHEHLSWYESMFGHVRHTGSGEIIANVTAALIRRRDMRYNFLEAIEEPTEESCTMGFELFNRNGHLKDKHKAAGSQIWGDSLDHGDILLIELIQVNKDHRREHLATRLCSALIEVARLKSDPKTFATFARTGVIDSEVPHSLDNESMVRERLRLVTASKHFFRSLGFRRVGTSDWFTIIGDTDHACYALSTANDFDPPLFQAPTFSIGMSSLRDALSNDKVPDTRCVEKFDAYLAAFGLSDGEWQLPDIYGNTILHLAATASKLKAVRWLLDNCPGCADARNEDRHSALDACLEVMEMKRSQARRGMMTFSCADMFTGHPENFIQTVCALRGINYPTGIELQRMRFGCTCGQCLDGFFSPRMQYLLLIHATRSGDSMEDYLSGDDGELFVLLNEHRLGFLRPSVRENLKSNKSMRQGLAMMYKHFITCLENSHIPSEQNITTIISHDSEWPPVTKNYLERGGTISAVGSELFSACMDMGPLSGDGGLVEADPDEYYALPKCRNDEDFGFVSAQCGYTRVGRSMYGE